MMRIPAVVFCSFMLISCATGDASTRQTVGTVSGVVIGGLIGSQIGGGSGRIVAAGVGALVGGLIGHQVATLLDENDRKAAAAAEQQARTAPIGESVTWSNPDTGNHGTVVATSEGIANDGRTCREFRHTVTVEGRAEDAFGTACLGSDGEWEHVQS